MDSGFRRNDELADGGLQPTVPARASRAAILRPHHALLLAIPVALLLGVALVVLLLAAREAEIDLDAVLLPVERERNERVALALDRADELVDLCAVEEQLARAPVFGDDVRRGRDQRHDRRAEQEDLAGLHDRVRIAEIHAPGAQALHFPAFERDAGLVMLVDVILVARALVQRDRAATVLVLAFRFRHVRYNRSNPRMTRIDSVP